jgi:hypothetical protein
MNKCEIKFVWFFTQANVTHRLGAEYIDGINESIDGLSLN